ncbi:MAG: DUF4007 family protein [Selenomonadaceae bacterium]|nr:DUF4007 family protein [Selenomonadaceae bacterium]
MKFRAHDTFFIRKGWLSKGMRCVDEKPDVFVAREENPMDVLGLGANMVKALRWWLQAVGLTTESKIGKRIQTFTELGATVYESDRYIEERGTLWLLQYRLATQIDEATAWHFFFNEFSMSEFTRDDFVRALQKFIAMSGADEVALRSLADDFDCIVRTYLPRHKMNSAKDSPENNIDCPFGELGLLEVLNKRKNLYRKNIPPVETLNPFVVFAVIADNAHGRRELSLNELLHAPRNIGRVFNLDSVAMLECLYEIEKLGLVKINRTAGLDVVNILQDATFSDCVRRFYESMEDWEQ